MEKINRTLGPLVCTRKLKQEGSTRVVTVRLGRPRRLRDSSDWVCHFEIVGIEKGGVQSAEGVDAFQSLMIALEGIRRSLEAHTAKLTWKGGEEGETGFPRYIPESFGLAFARRMGRMIDQEIERLVAPKKNKYEAAARNSVTRRRRSR